MTHTYKLTQEVVQNLLGILDMLVKKKDQDKVFTILFLSVLTDLYKKLFKLNYSMNMRGVTSGNMKLSVIEVAFLFIAMEYNKEITVFAMECELSVSDKRTMLLIDQATPAHWIKPIEIFRALLNPLTGERYSKGQLVQEGSVS